MHKQFIVKLCTVKKAKITPPYSTIYNYTNQVFGSRLTEFGPGSKSSKKSRSGSNKHGTNHAKVKKNLWHTFIKKFYGACAKSIKLPMNMA